MDRLLLSGGSYSARSIIASSLRCINYYPEINPKDALVPFTYYQRAGKKAISLGGDVAPRAACRGLYMASNGSAFTVIGSEVFKIIEGADDSGWSLKKLGEVTAGLSTPVSMIDNGGVLMIVDGVGGWQVALTAISVVVQGNVYNTSTIDHITSSRSVGTTGIMPGMSVVEASIPGGARVQSINSETAVTLSAAAGAPTAEISARIDNGAGAAGTTLTVYTASGTSLAVGMTVTDDSGEIAPGTTITALGTGTGGAGTYTVSNSQLVPTSGPAEFMRAISDAGTTITFQAGEDFFAPIVDASGTFTAADRIDYLDGFILWNVPDSLFFGSTLFSNSALYFDPLYVAGKTGYPDKLLSLIVNRHELLLLGRVKSEVWYDAGGATFPFAELPGAYVEHGLAAKYSVASMDTSIFWLGRDLQGQGIVWRQEGYKTTRVSNHALELALRKMLRIDDAIGYTFQVDGHYFYVLHFPTGDQSWVFDDSISDPLLAWHQEAWSSPIDGTMHRDRANCHALIFGKNVVGDWENGQLYELDLDTYTDEVGGVVGPLVCVKSFQHIHQLSRPTPGGITFSHPTNGRMIQFSKFWLDIECGMAPENVDGSPAQISLRWSDDRGRTFGNDVLQSNGALGEYLTQPQWPGLGIARDRIFEISHSINGPAALNGAWIEAEIVNE